jgi:hypothetical protein
MAEFSIAEETINNIVNINALGLVLVQNGIITDRQFARAKEQAIAEFKRDYPELVKEEK